jgi:hypothetical protein
LTLTLPAVSFFVLDRLDLKLAHAAVSFSVRFGIATPVSGGQLLSQIPSIDSVGGLQMLAVFFREVAYCGITPVASLLPRNKPIVKRRFDVDSLYSALGIVKPVWDLLALLSRRLLCDAAGRRLALL